MSKATKPERMIEVKRAYVKPKAIRMDFVYEEQVTANSITFVGQIGSLYDWTDQCQMGVNEQGVSTCTHYFYSVPNPCKTDTMPMSLDL